MKYLITAVSILFMSISCRQNTLPITGTYYHGKGDLVYYTMNVSAQKDSQSILFEGLPLEDARSKPWTFTCTAKRSGNSLKCDKIVVNFSSQNHLATVYYTDKKVQTFISEKDHVQEEVIRYAK